MLIVAGLHVPVIPFVEVVGRIGAVEPLHIGAIALNIGVVCGFTVTVNVAVLMQQPVPVVKVYVVVVVGLAITDEPTVEDNPIEGLQVYPHDGIEEAPNVMLPPAQIVAGIGDRVITGS